MKTLKITARISSDESPGGVMAPMGEDFFTEIVLDENAIVGDEKQDDMAFRCMTDPLLERVRERLGIEDPIVKETRALQEVLDSGGPIPDWLIKKWSTA